MTTATPRTDKETVDDGFEDAISGYGLILPCEKRTPPCDQEAEWFASQHGCIKAYLCDAHMFDCYWDVVHRMMEYNGARCTVCKGIFHCFDDFIQAVRI